MSYTGNKTGYPIPIPSFFQHYVEPFVGSGAVLFNLTPKDFIINDRNTDIYNLYIQIRDHPKEFMDILDGIKNNAVNHRVLGEWFNSEDRKNASLVFQASVYLFLNKVNYNGQCHHLKTGKLCISYSGRKKLNTYDEFNILACSSQLKYGTIHNVDYYEIFKMCQPRDFVFIDPPYFTRTFDMYGDDFNVKVGSYEKHEELFERVKELHDRGCFITVTYNLEPKIQKWYTDIGFSVKLHTKLATYNPSRGPRKEYVEMFLYNFVE